LKHFWLRVGTIFKHSAERFCIWNWWSSLLWWSSATGLG
jgi:hypothetical protein